MNKSPITELEELNINNRSRNYLKEISKWTFFLSIIGFVGVALMVVVGIFAGTIYGQAFNALNTSQLPVDMGMTMTFIYIIFALIYFMPVLYLYKFSRRLKVAFASKNDDKLADAIEMLKSHYKYIGVLMIIVLSLYTLLFIVAMLGVAIS